MPSEITSLEIALQANHAVAWPHYAGSSLRGAFGRALRQAACVTGQAQCGGCPLRNSCAYGVVFDPIAPVQPLHPSFNDGIPRYIVQPPSIGAGQLQPGQTLNFRLLMLPGSQAHVSLIEHVLRSTVEIHLVTAGTFKLLNIKQLDPLGFATPNPYTQSTKENASLTFRFQTPLRIQRQGRPVFKPQDLDSQTLIGAIYRRQLQWLQLLNRPDAANQLRSRNDIMEAANWCTLDTQNLYWHDLSRHSSTQHKKLPLGGLIGTLHLNGPASALQKLHPLFDLCQHIHVGKETVMGLGRYQLSGALTN